MHNDIRQETITTTPLFEKANCKFYRGQISEVVKMKRIHPHENNMKGPQRFEKICHKQGLVVKV